MYMDKIALVLLQLVLTTSTASGDGTPAPTPPSTNNDIASYLDDDGITSCDLWECGAGYTNVMRDCATGQSPYGRRLQATEDSVNDGFYTTDGYTTLGNIAICSQEACCDEAATHAPTPLDGIVSCNLWECGVGYTNVQRDCSTTPSPYGRRLQAAEAYLSDGFVTSDGYTTLGNYPICGEEACCDPGGTMCGTTGIEGILGTNDSGSVCCPSGCTKCGGSGCGSIGAAQGLDNTDCCISGVLRSQGLCSSSGTAPCVVDGGATCATAGVEGILGANDNGSVCCPLGCTQCGGSGCAKAGKAEGLDGTDCCVNGVLGNQDLCSVSGIAPCVL